MESLLITLVVGAVAGWGAGQIMTGGGFGLLWNIIIGIAGGVIGGLLLSALGAGFEIGGPIITSIIVALIGACVLIFVIGLIKKR